MDKITKRRFIALMNEKLAQNQSDEPFTTTDMYELFMDVLTDELIKGNPIILTGFGNFELKPHRGHRIGFSDSDRIDDYLIVKFDTSNVFNRRLRTSNPDLFDEIMARENVNDKTKDK